MALSNRGKENVLCPVMPGVPLVANMNELACKIERERLRRRGERICEECLLSY